MYVVMRPVLNNSTSQPT